MGRGCDWCVQSPSFLPAHRARQVDHFQAAMAALDADPSGLSARVSALGQRRPPRAVNEGLAALNDLPRKCYSDWRIPLQPVVLPAATTPSGAGAAAAAAAAGNATGAGGGGDDGGWRYVETESEGGREIQKRGWVVRRVGARALLRVNTAWGGEGIDNGAAVTVGIGWGLAHESSSSVLCPLSLASAAAAVVEE